MKSSRFALILTLSLSFLLLQNVASASPSQEMVLIRSLAPVNYDLAKVQAAILGGVPEEIAFESAKDNYLYRDLNRDGIDDLVVIYEEKPTVINYETDQPCESFTEDAKCMLVYGPRLMNIYLSQTDGSLKLVISKNDYILSGDDGGIFGDPLVGLGLNAKNTISIEFYGGSNWRWGYTDKIQYRNGDFYLIGKESIQMFLGDMSFQSKSENLLTGKVIEQSSKGEGFRVHTKTYRSPKKPLIRFSNYTN